jgi:hypothetical protein
MDAAAQSRREAMRPILAGATRDEAIEAALVVADHADLLDRALFGVVAMVLSADRDRVTQFAALAAAARALAEAKSRKRSGRRAYDESIAAVEMMLTKVAGFGLPALSWPPELAAVSSELPALPSMQSKGGG